VARFCNPASLDPHSIHYVGEAAMILTHSLSAGNTDHFRRVQAWFAAQKIQVSMDDAWTEAIRQGLPYLAMYLYPMDLTKSHRPHDVEDDDSPAVFSFVDAAFNCVSTASLEFCAATWPDVVAYYIGRLPYSDCTLLGLKWAASYANRYGLDMDYEAIHVHLRERHVDDSRNERLTLEWLAPLALARFSRRLEKDSKALPVFGNTRDQYTYRMHGLGVVYNKFPGLQDSQHYAFHHPKNKVYVKARH